MEKQQKNNMFNVINIGLVSLFMQLGSTFIYSTGTALVAKRLFGDEFTFLLIRNIGESTSSFYKLLSGFLSDIVDDRKSFLYFGYGLIILFKLMFWFTAFDFCAISVLKIIFIVAHLLDRVMNSIRDAPRDAILFASNEEKNKTFAIRKLIGSIGSILGGVICTILLYAKYNNTRIIHGLAIIPIIIANIILYYTVKDVKQVSNTNKTKLHIPWWYLLTKISYTICAGLIYYFLIWNQHFSLQLIYSFIVGSWILNTETLSIKYLVPYIISVGTLILTKASSINSIYLDLFIFPICLCIFFWFFGSEQYKTLRQYKLKNYYLFLIVCGFLSLSKMNDSIFFSMGDKVQLLGSASVVVMFTINYITQLGCSFLFGKYAKRFNDRWLILFSCVMNMVLNIFLFMVNSKSQALFLAILLGITNSIELILLSTITKFIPNDNIKGTLFGVFYFILGFTSIFCTLITNKFHNLINLGSKYLSVQYTGLICTIPAIIALILVLIFNTTNQEHHCKS